VVQQTTEEIFLNSDEATEDVVVDVSPDL